MGSLSDSFADQEREEETRQRLSLEARCRAAYKKEMDSMDFDELHWLWDNKQKILAQKSLIDLIGKW